MKILLILVLSVFSFANNVTLEKVNDIGGESLIMKSNGKSCIIKYADYGASHTETNCEEMENTKGIKFLCMSGVQNKAICKTEGEISYFKVTGEPLSTARWSNQPPFIGDASFNFMGGNGTDEILTIDKNAIVTFEHVTPPNIRNTYGEDTTRLPFPKKDEENIVLERGVREKLNSDNSSYLIDKNVICSIEYQNVTLCTKLYRD